MAQRWRLAMTQRTSQQHRFECLMELGALVEDAGKVAAAAGGLDMRRSFQELSVLGHLMRRSGELSASMTRSRSPSRPLARITRGALRQKAVRSKETDPAQRSPRYIKDRSKGIGSERIRLMDAPGSGRDIQDASVLSDKDEGKDKGKGKDKDASDSEHWKAAATDSDCKQLRGCDSDEESWAAEAVDSDSDNEEPGEPPLPRPGEDFPMWEDYSAEEPFARTASGLFCVFCEVDVSMEAADEHVAKDRHIRYAEQGMHSFARLCKHGPSLWREGIAVKCYTFECKTCGVADQQWWQLFGWGKDHVETAKHMRRAAQRSDDEQDRVMSWEKRRQQRWEASLKKALRISQLERDSQSAGPARLAVGFGPAGPRAQKGREIGKRKRAKKGKQDKNNDASGLGQKGWAGRKPKSADEASDMLRKIQARQNSKGELHLLDMAWLARLAQEHHDSSNMPGGPDVRWLDIGLDGNEIRLTSEKRGGSQVCTSVYTLLADECVRSMFPTGSA